jgi:hypothetical protein
MLIAINARSDCSFLEKIAAAPSLKTLTVSNCAQLGGTLALQQVRTIEWSAKGTVDLAGLETLSSLRRMFLTVEKDDTGVRIDHLEQLSRLPHLTGLSIEAPDVAVKLPQIPKLQTLLLASSSIQSLEAIGDAPLLSFLVLSAPISSPAGIGRFSNLRAAHFFDVRMPSGLEEFRSLPRLEELVLYGEVPEDGECPTPVPPECHVVPARP